MTDKNPPPCQIREYQPRQPAPGSHKALMRALSDAASELGVQMATAGLPHKFEPHEEVTWKLPSGVRPGPLPESGLIPPFVHVRLPVRDPERTRSQFISAVVEAASVDWYRPTEAYGVREPLVSLWPQLRERGPVTEGLAEHLETVIDIPGESSVEWFYHAAGTATEAAFLAGAPVLISAQLVTASGSWASMGTDIPIGCLPRRASIAASRGRHPRRNRLQRRRGLVARPRDRTRHSRLRPQGQLSERSDARFGRARPGHARRRGGVTPRWGGSRRSYGMSGRRRCTHSGDRAPKIPISGAARRARLAARGA